MSYNGPVTDPFRIPAPDGQTYFDVLNPPRSLLPLYTVLTTNVTRMRTEEARATYAAAKTYWKTWALAFQKQIVDIESKMRAAALEAAQVADAEARRQIKATQVRPDTSKARHMEDNLVSRHIAVGPIELGGVGLFDVSVLDKTRRQRGGTYWEAQEFGTDAHIGREVRGFFMPGRARPSQQDFRVHPEFQARGRGPRMTIQNPIEERGFLRHGVEAAYVRRLARMNAIAADTAKLIKAFRASVVPPPPSGGRTSIRAPRRR